MNTNVYDTYAGVEIFSWPGIGCLVEMDYGKPCFHYLIQTLLSLCGIHSAERNNLIFSEFGEQTANFSSERYCR